MTTAARPKRTPPRAIKKPPRRASGIDRVRLSITAFNRGLAIRLTSAVGTMACAYAFCLLAILGFPGWHATPTAYVQWVSQTLIQLVMLSVIMVGQQIMGDQQAHHHHENTRMHAKHAGDIASLHRKIDALTAKKETPA
jgi:hypothetical protein